jgi:uncharacterized protein (TIGR02145 family)
MLRSILILSTIYIVFISCEQPESFTDPRDGKTYKVIKLGKQTWMAENLSFKTDSGCWVYNNDNKYLLKYGYLYNWESAILACPEGWRIPTDEDWKTLEVFLGMNKSHADMEMLRGMNEGGELKATGTADWNAPNQGATNSTGFSALPGGLRSEYGNYNSLGENGWWWSSTELKGEYAWYRSLRYSGGDIERLGFDKVVGLSVRCLKNN